MDDLIARVARAIARKDNPKFFDGSDHGYRLWEAECERYVQLAVAAIDAVIANGLGEDEPPDGPVSHDRNHDA